MGIIRIRNILGESFYAVVKVSTLLYCGADKIPYPVHVFPSAFHHRSLFYTLQLGELQYRKPVQPSVYQIYSRILLTISGSDIAQCNHCNDCMTFYTSLALLTSLRIDPTYHYPCTACCPSCATAVNPRDCRPCI